MSPTISREAPPHKPCTALTSALNLAPEDYSLLTDLYQLTMSACYVGEGLAEKRASFELFARKLPEGFGYLMAMGLEPVLDYLQNLCVLPDQIAALRGTGIFDRAPSDFWTLLASGRFTGDVWAVPEGTAVFAGEPLLRVEAPLWQAQWVETYLLNAINYQTLIATKAARMRDIAGQQTHLLEFGTRRAFSPQGALWAARAALAGGLDATSNVLAALKLGQQPAGTMAHALVMVFEGVVGSEDEAFAAFGRYFPGAPLLIDTYDTVAAAERLAQQKQEVKAVRLDSGDLVKLSKKVRSLLPETAIFASGDLDEWEIARLQAAGACIDGYGIGTKLVTGSPVNGVYKLVEIEGTPTMKQSSGKITYPGRKQVFRGMERDRLGLASEAPEAGERALLQPMMLGGERLYPSETIEAIRDRAIASVANLPPQTRQLDNPAPIEVEISAQLQQLTHCVRDRIMKGKS